jgi:hypothetical protein
VAPPGDVGDCGFGDFGDASSASGRRWGRVGGFAWWMIRGACGREVVASGTLELARRSLQQASAGVGPAHPTHPNPPGPSQAATWPGASTLQYPIPSLHWLAHISTLLLLTWQAPPRSRQHSTARHARDITKGHFIHEPRAVTL